MHSAYLRAAGSYPAYCPDWRNPASLLLVSLLLQKQSVVLSLPDPRLRLQLHLPPSFPVLPVMHLSQPLQIT